ncbi:TPA: hypothetical protein NJ173_001708 [Vibrio parahaemolyticus]|nr:hypothetical protein [Vibrio parahaemolyticus]
MKYSDFIKSKIFVDIQLWVFNGLAAISIAYFFALLSAGSPEHFSLAIEASTILFSVSLVMNSALALIIIVSGKDSDFLYFITTSKYLSWLPIVGMYSPAIAILFLLAHFSIIALLTVVIVIVLIPVLFRKALSAQSAANEKRRLEIEQERLDHAYQSFLRKIEEEERKEGREI